MKYTYLNAGSFWSDGGAALGVLPKALWHKEIFHDEQNRIEMSLNLLLINSSGKNILIDTGIGNRVSDKIRKIFKVSDFCLLRNLEKLGFTRYDIDYVVFTHLHFDHAGGIVTRFEKDELTFPNALHVIQKKEWEIAKSPDALNKAAYNFNHHLKLLEESGKFKLISGDYQLLPGIELKFAGGHSNGSQYVKITDKNELAIYSGDIIPSIFHVKLHVTSAYDVCRPNGHSDVFR